MFYRFLADLTVIAHVAYVAFVLLGLLVIVVGMLCRWQWVRNFWFRAVHLLAMTVVGFEAVMGWTCPLTTLEHYLRQQSGSVTYTGDFLGHWAGELLFYEGEDWMFNTAYVLCTLLILAIFIFAPPRWPWRRRELSSTEANPLPVVETP